MRSFGRLLQYVGLGVPPFSILLQLQEAISLSTMLVMLVASIAAFWLGRLMEGYAPR